VATAEARTGRSEVWRWLAWVALVVLIVEWLVYQRSALAWLRERWLPARRDRSRRAGT
jgi:hypothetical protein